jgi:hypothetical protein
MLFLWRVHKVIQKNVFSSQIEVKREHSSVSSKEAAWGSQINAKMDFLA